MQRLILIGHRLEVRIVQLSHEFLLQHLPLLYQLALETANFVPQYGVVVSSLLHLHEQVIGYRVQGLAVGCHAAARGLCLPLAAWHELTQGAGKVTEGAQHLHGPDQYQDARRFGVARGASRPCKDALAAHTASAARPAIALIIRVIADGRYLDPRLVRPYLREAIACDG
eukprot:scaffold179_cov368-Prasinococcus_capsulatus_cf.AAC.2